MTRIGEKRKFKFSLPTKSDIPLLLLLLPAIVTTIVFSYLPMQGILVAFKVWDGGSSVFELPWAANFGFDNFLNIFRTPGIDDAIWNTLYWNVLSLLIGFPLPIIFALLLDEVKSKKFKSVTQTISYLPHFLSWIAVVGIVCNLIDEYGLINDFIRSTRDLMLDGVGLLGSRGILQQDLVETANAFINETVKPVIFREDGKYFLPVYLIVTVWKGLGWDSIIYLSALSGISQDLYEAADIDGANRFQRVWHITIPHLMPTAMILLIMKVGQIFGSNFELVYGLQNTQWTTEVISTAVYNFGFGTGAYDLAAALSLLQGVVALILTLSANKISNKLTEISMW